MNYVKDFKDGLKESSKQFWCSTVRKFLNNHDSNIILNMKLYNFKLAYIVLNIAITYAGVYSIRCWWELPKMLCGAFD